MLRACFVPGVEIGYDFLPMWVTAGMAVRGTQAYGQDVQAVLDQLGGPGTNWICAYPPTALLVWLPFSVMPFAVAVAAWLSVTAAAYASAIRALAGPGMVVAALAYPAVLICILYGQNSLLSAALFAFAAAMLDRRPFVAGLLIGCLAFKPQLAILAPLALAVSGRWQAFAGAAVGLAAFVVATIGVFGVDD